MNTIFSLDYSTFHTFIFIFMGWPLTKIYSVQFADTWGYEKFNWSAKFNFFFVPRTSMCEICSTSYAELRYVYRIFLSDRVLKIQRNLNVQNSTLRAHKTGRNTSGIACDYTYSVALRSCRSVRYPVHGGGALFAITRLLPVTTRINCTAFTIASTCSPRKFRRLSCDELMALITWSSNMWLHRPGLQYRIYNVSWVNQKCKCVKSDEASTPCAGRSEVFLKHGAVVNDEKWGYSFLLVAVVWFYTCIFFLVMVRQWLEYFMYVSINFIRRINIH
jgi:hypothetical protein